jgi:hypothetical protein
MQEPATDTADRIPQPQQALPKQGQSLPEGKWSKRRKAFVKLIGLPTTLLGLVTLFFSFFPHLTLSEPATLNSALFFSRSTTLTNEGILPVFRVRCGLRIRKITFNEGGAVQGKEDFSAGIERTDCYAGTLSPGDGYTFELDNVLQIENSHVADADFAISVSYVPLLPPVRMEKCVHFTTYRDSSGQIHWFRSPGHCRMFPWLHIL